MDYPGNEPEKKRNAVKEFFSLGPVFKYYFRKHDPHAKTNTNLKLMHGINKISIVMFLACLLVLFFRYVVR